MQHFSRLSTSLLTARQGSILLSSNTFEGKGLNTLMDAYKIHSAMLTMPGFNLKGYKVGATNEASQKNLGLDCPFRAPLPLSAITSSPSTGLNVHTSNIRGIECEFTFKLHSDLKPRKDGKDFTVEDVKEVIESVYPSIEVCANRFTGDIPIALRVADGGGNCSLVLGKQNTSWRNADFAKANVVLKVNNRTKAKGNGSMVMGNPLTSLTWLANSLLLTNQYLEAEHFICTGTMTGMTPVVAGDEVVASFGPFGNVEIKFNH